MHNSRFFKNKLLGLELRMNIVHCGLLCRPSLRGGAAYKSVNSFLRRAWQGANKFFTLAMRPVQQLTWGQAGHGC